MFVLLFNVPVISKAIALLLNFGLIKKTYIKYNS